MTANSNLEQEVWGQEVAYWEYVKTADLERYRSLWHEEVMGWPNNQPAPMNKDGIQQLMAGLLAVLQSGSGIVELKPLSVRVYNDNIGIAYYEVHARATTKAGAEVYSQERLTHTWLRTEDGWKIIGGMSAPQPHSQTD